MGSLHVEGGASEWPCIPPVCSRSSQAEWACPGVRIGVSAARPGDHPCVVAWTLRPSLYVSCGVNCLITQDATSATSICILVQVDRCTHSQRSVHGSMRGCDSRNLC